MTDHTRFKQRFDPLFITYLRQQVAELPSDVPESTRWSASLISFAMHGKRVRPFIAFLGSNESLETLAESPVLHMLFAIELYHLFALIHDDLMDRDETRHGESCIHVTMGNDRAILLGDLCLSWAHECVSALCANREDGLYISTLFSALSKETIMGQLLDRTLCQMSQPTEALYDRVIELKTARYTFIYPLFLGRTFDDSASGRDTLSLVRFGRALGHAFQRLDDMADVFWNEEKLGKMPCGDFRSGTPTHLSLFVQERGNHNEREACSALFGNSEGLIAVIRTLLVQSGAYEHEVRSITQLLEDARVAVAKVHDAERWESCIEMLEAKLNTL
jgi:geranylgeranyl diphosphate synthase, type I